jgi:hypothetical protein
MRSPLSKKWRSLLSSIRPYNSDERPLLRGPTAKPPFGSRLTLSDRFYTPTLIRPDNERREKAHVFQIEAEYGAGRRMVLRHQRESIRYHCSIHDHCCMHGFISARAASADA